jgi:hypothetical protein
VHGVTGSATFHLLALAAIRLRANVIAIFEFASDKGTNVVVCTNQFVYRVVVQILRIEQSSLVVGFAHQKLLHFQEQAGLLGKNGDNLVRGQ